MPDKPAGDNPLDAFLAEARNAMVAAIRADGRPMMTPNWFWWDGTRFTISTTRSRAKYRQFLRDPRVQLAIDDATGFRSVLVDGTVTINEDPAVSAKYIRAIREKHGKLVGSDDELAAEIETDGRVLLVVTPDRPPAEWRVIGL